MATKKLSNIEKFLALSDAEKDAEVNRALKGKWRPMTLEERQHWDRVQAGLKAAHRRKIGRPKTGKGVKVISLSVEQGLLARADAYAKEQKISRAALVARGLEAVLDR